MPTLASVRVRGLLMAALVCAATFLAALAPSTATAAPEPWEIKQVASGEGFTCALRVNGTITCFGANWHGQLGNGTTNDAPAPTQVAGITNATSITAGTSHACAILADRTVKCWGSNYYFQVVTPFTAAGFIQVVPTPLAVPNITDAVSIAAGTLHTCAVLSGGGMRCWGDATFGALGTGRTTYNGADFPVSTVSGIGDAIAVAAGSIHTCALRAGGKVSCWGGNNRGQLGAGYWSNAQPTPREISGLTDAVQVSLGGFHSCARKANGTLSCWGDSRYGQVGNGYSGDHAYETTPQSVDLPEVVDIVTGDRHTCALRAGGKVSCWGDTERDQDGNPFITGTISRPLEVQGFTAAAGSVLSRAWNGACVLEPTSPPALWCWGAGVVPPPTANGNAALPTRIDLNAPVTTDDVPTDGRPGPYTVTLTVHDLLGLGATTTYEIIRANGSISATQTYDPAAKPVLGNGEAIRYRSVSTAGPQESTRTSAALGGTAQATVDPATIDLGLMTLGSSKTVNVTYSVAGGDMPAISWSTTGSPGLTLSGVPTSATNGSSTTFQVSVNPTNVGAFEAQIAIADDSVTPVSIRVHGFVERLYTHGQAFTRDALALMPADISQVAVDAIDSDPFPDIAAASAATGQVWVLRGRGNGTLESPVELQGAGTPGQTGLAIADLDGDADMDITNGSRLFKNVNNTGQFAAGQSTGLQGRDVAAGDLDADGDEDLVLITDAGIQVARNDGVGNFATPTAFAAPNPSGLLVADVDRDGDLDIVTSSRAVNHLTLLRGDGNGGLSAEELEVGAPSSAVAIGDLNGDLRRDLSTGDRYLPGQPDGSFGPARSGGSADAQLLISDFDGDKRDDQLTAHQDRGVLTLRRGDGSGGFAPADEYDAGIAGGAHPGDLGAADFDRDGRMDAVVVRDSRYVELLLGGRGTPNHHRLGAKITEVQFGDNQYVKITNVLRNTTIRLDGWRVWMNTGFHMTLPLSSPLAPGASVYIGAPANAGGARYAPLVRNELRMPSGLRSVRVDGADSTPADTVGFDAEIREGGGLPSRTFVGDGAFVRRSVNGSPQDTDDNAADFQALDTRADEGSDLILGSPRPDRWDAPTNRNDILQSSLVDPSASAAASPNRITAGGYMTINRTITNCSGAITTGVCANADKGSPAVKVTKLRFRVTALSTYGTSSNALLRLVASEDATYGGVTVRGLPLDAPSPATGGGLNASQVATQVLPGDGLDPGESINVAFRFKVDRGGPFVFGYDTEDDLVELPKATAPPTAAESVPDAAPAPDTVKGTLSAAAATPPTAAPASSPAPATAAPAVSSPLPPKAASKPTKRCVTRQQFKKLRGKARARAKICKPSKTKRTSATTRKKKADR